MRQFFLDTTDQPLPGPGDTVALDQEESHHLFTVLRGGRAKELHLVDGLGHRLTGEAAGREGKRALVKLTAVENDPHEGQAPQLAVACAVVKGKRFEWALEKAVELGAHHIVPLRCEHGVIDPRTGKQSRWVSVMKSAVKQCGRSWLPTLASPQTLAECLAEGLATRSFFGAAPWELPAGEVAHWTTLLSDEPATLPASLGFFVGPEGGWSPAELELLAGHAQALSLGPHVLRAETAVAAGLTALQAVRQNWRHEA